MSNSFDYDDQNQNNMAKKIFLKIQFYYQISAV